jgi:hypothetical protein
LILFQIVKRGKEERIAQNIDFEFNTIVMHPKINGGYTTMETAKGIFDICQLHDKLQKLKS